MRGRRGVRTEAVNQNRAEETNTAANLGPRLLRNSELEILAMAQRVKAVMVIFLLLIGQYNSTTGIVSLAVVPTIYQVLVVLTSPRTLILGTRCEPVARTLGLFRQQHN